MGGEKPGARWGAAPSPGDRHPLPGPPGPPSAPAWEEGQGLTSLPRAARPTVRIPRPRRQQAASCQVPLRGAEEQRGSFSQQDRAGLAEGGRATCSSGQLAPWTPCPILPSVKAGRGDHCPRAPCEGQGIVFDAQRERAGPSAQPTMPRWQSLWGHETVRHPSQPSGCGKGFQGPGQQDNRARGTQRDPQLSRGIGARQTPRPRGNHRAASCPLGGGPGEAVSQAGPSGRRPPQTPTDDGPSTSSGAATEPSREDIVTKPGWPPCGRLQISPREGWPWGASQMPGRVLLAAGTHPEPFLQEYLAHGREARSIQGLGPSGQGQGTLGQRVD